MLDATSPNTLYLAGAMATHGKPSKRLFAPDATGGHSAPQCRIFSKKLVFARPLSGIIRRRGSAHGRIGTDCTGHAAAVDGPGDAAQATDRELLERFATAREESAFRALLERHGPMVRGVCLRVTLDDHEADDAFQ